MTRTIAMLLFLCLVAGAAAGEDPAVDAFKREIRAIRAADAVVLARVVIVHRGPEVWCGIVATRQEVSWRIEEVISTSLPGEIVYDDTAAHRPIGWPAPKVGTVVRVGHLLVGGGIVRKDYPSVRPDLIHTGARAILLLHQEKDRPADTRRTSVRYVVQDETIGVRLLDPPLVADPDRKAVLAALLDSKALAPYLHPETEGRKPVRIALSKALPDPVPGLRKFDLPVLFLPREELEKDPFLEVTELSFEGDNARVAFTYDEEGVAGHALLKRAGGGYAIVEAEISER